MKRLVVLPADPLYKYVEKGEIKKRYWNPCDIFDEVHVISLSSRDVEPEQVRELAGRARFEIHPIGRPSALTLAGYYRRVRRLIGQLQPDLIRAHGPWHTGSLAVYAGRALDIPALVSVHSDRDAQRRREASLLLHAVRPLEYYTLHNAHVVICVSDYLHGYAKRHGAQRSYTIYNKVYCEQFDVRQASRRGQGPLQVLSVMRLDRAKDPQSLIEAIAPLDFHLKLIGQGELGNELRAQVRHLGMEDRVEFIASVPNGEIHTHYLQADIFAMATYYEGFCIPVLEAMAAGLPVVASDTGPIPEVLGGTGVVVKREPAAFTQAFVELAADAERRAALGAAARRRAEAVDGGRMEEREAHLYQAIMQGRRDELDLMLSDGGRSVN